MRFMNAMHSIVKVTGKDVATAFDLSHYKTACDIGGTSFFLLLTEWYCMLFEYLDNVGTLMI